MIKELLHKIGLTPTETKIYMALLDIGEAKVGEILDKAELNSGRIYDVLQSLISKGLVSTIIKKKVKHFIPSHPEKILQYYNDKISNMQENKKELGVSMPDLVEKFNHIKQPTQVEFYSGIEGLKTAYINFHSNNKTKNLYVHGIVKLEMYPKKIKDYIQYNLYPERRKLKLKIRKIAAKGTRNERIDADNSEIKYLPYPSMTSTEILGDKVMILLLQSDLLVILIENKSIADDFRKQFEFMWAVAK